VVPQVGLEPTTHGL